MVLSSLISGSVLGILGSVGTGVLDYFKQKEKNKHELAMMGAQKALIEAQGANAVSLEAAKNFGKSHDSDEARYVNKEAITGWLGLLFNFLMVLVDFLRGWTRPGMTWYFVLASTVVCLWSFERAGVDDAFLKKIVEVSIATLLELTGVCVTWWFGARGIQRLGK